MRHKNSSKSFGMACFGCLFQKKPSRSRKGKNTSGANKSKQGTSKNLSANIKRDQSGTSKNLSANIKRDQPGTSKNLSGNSKRSQSLNKAPEIKNEVVQKSHGAENSDGLIEIRMKIMSFRELVDLPVSVGSLTVIQLVKQTVKELQKLYPDVVHCVSLSDSEGTMDKAINELCASIESLGKHWMRNDEWMVKSKKDDRANGDLEKHALALLDDIINVARENKTHKDNDKETKDNVESPSSSNGKSSSRSYPDKVPSPTSVLHELSTKISAKIDPHVAEGDEGENKNVNHDCNVKVQMEISLPSSSLKSIVDPENIQLILAGGSPSSYSERPSLSATIVSSPPPSSYSDDTPSSKIAANHTTESSPTATGKLPSLPPSPPPSLVSVGEGDDRTRAPPPSLVSVGEGDDRTRAPPPPPPPPPSSKVTGNVATLPLPPSSSGNGLPASLGLPPSSPPAPTAPGSVPPPPPPPGVTSSSGSVPAPPPVKEVKGGAPPPPPPPGVTSSDGSVPPPPPVQEVKGGAPPPPPGTGNGGRLLRKSVSKLRRSSQMGCLYRQLKAKVEGSGGTKKTLQKKDSKVGAASGGSEKKGMADALAEMTRRSSYFQQIEEDVKNHSDSIKEVKDALVTFQTTDMDELINFHNYVESHLEKLTDETQVLARFEDFPSKKLEGLRMAAALYSKLDAIADTLQNWNIEPPANQLLDRIENYFNKIKEELDTLDRTKDEEVKKFKSQKIHFDFAILIKIKELMVDISSSCMELALKERKLASASRKNSRKTSSGKVLWNAFQFAFRVYSFAGGYDDRAENLTRELAQQIQADTVH